MPNHGDLKWIQKKFTRSEIEAEIGNLNEIENITLKYITEAGEFVTGGFGVVSIAAFGGSVALLLAATIITKNKDVLEEVLNTLKANPQYKSVYLSTQYRYTVKDGGLWIPTYKMRIDKFSTSA